jgi:hypothetical protein
MPRKMEGGYSHRVGQQSYRTLGFDRLGGWFETASVFPSFPCSGILTRVTDIARIPPQAERPYEE